MTTTTIFAATNDDYLWSRGFTLADMQNGTGGGSFTPRTGSTDGVTDRLEVGQLNNGSDIEGWESFLDFDTSSVGASSIISAATLSLWGNVDNSTTDFTVEARPFNWSIGLDAADWRTPAQCAALTLAASLSTVGFSTTAYNAFAESGTNLRTNINQSGHTYLMLNSDRYRTGAAPGFGEEVNFKSADTAGTTSDPKLVLTYTAVPQAPTGFSAAAGSPVPNVNTNWTAPAGGDAPTGYKVDRATDSGFTTGLVTTDVGNVTSWTDTTTAFTTTYWYRVKGYNAAGDGAVSGSSSLTTGSSSFKTPRPHGLSQAVHRAAHF